MDDAIKKMIVEVVDLSLSSVSKKRDSFYRTLKKEYNLKRGDIPEHYSIFHEALRNFFDFDHYVIEREMVRILHERTMMGLYDRQQEITVFGMILESYLYESKRLSQIDYILLSNIERQLGRMKKSLNQSSH